MKVEVVDLDKVIARLAQLGEQVIGVATIAAYHEAEVEFPMTQDQVPIGPTGQLRLSGRIEGPDFSQGNELTVGIAYGGPPGSGLNDMDVDYAMQVHEDLEAHHPIGKAKYVEDVVRGELESGRAAERMGAEIIRKLGL